MMKSYIAKNQLQFNLAVPPTAANLAFRHQKPETIVVEKVGIQDGHRVVPPLGLNVSQPLQFNSLSQDKLSMAVQLAKRDMKKKKMEEEMKGFVMKGQGHSRNRSQSRSPSPQRMGKTKIIFSREHKERLRKHDVKKKPTNAMKVKEHGSRGQKIKTYSREVQIANSMPRDNARSPVRNAANLPVTTNSPPTRDTDEYPSKPLSKDEQQSAEIRRMQNEIQLFLTQIEDLEQRMLDGDLRQGNEVNKVRRRDDLFLEEEEDEVRRRMRSEEQATRSARTLYFLKQQVRDIQQDFARLGPSRIRHTKKSQALTRLASAHRGAVRAMQTYMSQLQGQQAQDGPPANYQELAMLIRQLTSLCTQLNVTAGQNSAVTDLISLLDRVDNLSTAWQEESRNIRAFQQPWRKSPEGKRDLAEGPVKNRNVLKDHRAKGVLRRQQARNVRKPTSRFKPQHRGKQPVNHSSPERKAALRAGLLALVRADEVPVGQSQGKSTAWDIPFRSELVYSSTPQRTVLLPPKLQAGREKSQPFGGAQIQPTGHFAEPTMASNMKAVIPQHNPITEPRSSSAPPTPRSQEAPGTPKSHPWIPSGTPKHTPHGHSTRSRSHSPGCVACARWRGSLEDISKELFSDEKPSQQGQGRVHFASMPRSRSPSPRARPKTRGRLAYLPEDHIRGRLQPLYGQSELLSKKQEAAQRSSEQAMRRQFMMDSDADPELRGEIMSELIFNDLLADTADELHRLEDEKTVREEAHRMVEAPSMEVMVQRLEQMEMEQEQIRRRWNTLKFDSVESRRPAGLVSNQPLSPQAMEISWHTGPRPRSHNVHVWHRDDIDEAPIMFTKTKFEQPQPVHSVLHGHRGGNSIHGSNPGNSSVRDVVIPRVSLSVPQDVLDEIHENLDKYQRHLKRTSHSTSGKFDPWKLVEVVSDEIMAECMSDVAKELEEVSSDIVNHVYSSEFTVADRRPPSPETMENGA